jgi:hypothetical protein
LKQIYKDYMLLQNNACATICPTNYRSKIKKEYYYGKQSVCMSKVWMPEL